MALTPSLRYLTEHLEEDYVTAWWTLLENGERDQALLNNGTSRWANYVSGEGGGLERRAR